jgi:hypothetical protein
MLQNTSLIILFLSLLASPAFGAGWNQNPEHPVNRPGMFMHNRIDFPTPPFNNRNSRLPVRPHDRTRLPRFIYFPYYGMDGVGSYDDEEYPVVNIIVDSHKKDEPTELPAKKEKPVAPPHIVTLGGSGSSKSSKSVERSESVVEIRGAKVSTTNLSPE